MEMMLIACSVSTYIMLNFLNMRVWDGSVKAFWKRNTKGFIFIFMFFGIFINLALLLLFSLLSWLDRWQERKGVPN